MLRKFIMLSMVVVAGLVSGCASVPMATPEQDAAARNFAVKPDMANIYVYRNETMGAGACQDSCRLVHAANV